MDRGAAFQKTDFSESRCTNHIDQSFGRLRCIADLAAKNLNDSSGSSTASNHPKPNVSYKLLCSCWHFAFQHYGANRRLAEVRLEVDSCSECKSFGSYRLALFFLSNSVISADFGGLFFCS